MTTEEFLELCQSDPHAADEMLAPIFGVLHSEGSSRWFWPGDGLEVGGGSTRVVSDQCRPPQYINGGWLAFGAMFDALKAVLSERHRDDGTPPLFPAWCAMHDVSHTMMRKKLVNPNHAVAAALLAAQEGE